MFEIIRKFWGLFIDSFFYLKLFRSIKSNLPYTIYDSGRKQTFYGYHDKTPFSKNGEILLAMASNAKNIAMAKPQEIEIGYFNINQPLKFNTIGNTNTWCWQQGARLMWFPDSENKLIIYNKLIDNQYASVIQNIKTKEIIKKLNFPVYDIDPSGRYAATLNFSKLGKLRPGYGYLNLPEEVNKSPQEDGIWIADIQTNEKKLIISLKQLTEISKDSKSPFDNHYINHLSFNPSGDRLLFFYIRTYGKKRQTNAYVCDIDGKNLILLNNGHNCSHFDWKNDKELLVFSQKENEFAYTIHHTKNGESNPLSPVQLKVDGHPYFISEQAFITDSYHMGIQNYQNLYFYPLKGQLIKLAKIFNPTQYSGEVRCDLHPRVSNDGLKICIDAPFRKGRKMIIFNFNAAKLIK